MTHFKNNSHRMISRIRAGFTLAEILVTVTIIAVLAAVVVPAVTQFASRGNAPVTKVEIGTLTGAVSNFTTDVLKYPGTMQQLVTDITISDSDAFRTVPFSATSVSKWKGPYSAATLGSVTAYYAMGGIPTQVGPAFSIQGSPAWLTTPIVSINGVTPPDCGGILLIDTAVDGSNFAGSEGTIGQIQWSGTCTSAFKTGTVISPVIRIIPAP